MKKEDYEHLMKEYEFEQRAMRALLLIVVVIFVIALATSGC